MKFLIGILFLSINILAATNWYNLDEAIQLSKKTDKKIMIVVYSENCPYCHGYFNSLKSNSKLNNTANESVYQVAIHQNDAIKIGLEGVHSVPSFLFFDANLKECTSPIYGLTRDINVLINKIKINCGK